MKKLSVPYLNRLSKHSPMAEVSENLDSLSKNLIDIAPWPAFDYKPSVSFSVAHSQDCLFIKYFVLEENIRAVFRRTNDPVYRDSCVEFFISFNNEPAYYNLEFNSLGTCRFGYGEGRENRQLLPEAVIRKIKRSAALSILPAPENQPVVKWELTLAIPAEAFSFHEFSNLSQQNCRVNFYKCGDDLPTPHYLSWNNIKAQEPDFHLPEYFGELQFL
jgi:hypothetical protein